MATNHPDLSAAFAAPDKSTPRDRAKSLSGLLPTRTDAPANTPASEAPTDSEPEQMPAPDTTPPATKPKRAPKTPVPTPSAEGDPNEILNLAVYLPEDLREWLIEQGHRKLTYADWLVAAFDAVTEQQLTEYFNPKWSTSPSGMPKAPEQPDPGTGPQRQFRMRRAQVQWIEQVAERTNAPSRSALCVAALRLFRASRREVQQ